MADVNIKSFGKLNEVNDNDIVYVVSKDLSDNDVDKNADLITIKNYVTGTRQLITSEINNDNVFLTKDQDGESCLTKYRDFEVKLFGQNESHLSPIETLKFRSFKDDGNRGYTTLGEIKEFIYVPDTEIESISDVNIGTLTMRLNRNVDSVITPVKLPVNKFRDWIYGSDTFSVVDNTDVFNISNSTKRGIVAFSTILQTILPNKAFLAETEVTDNLRLFGTTTERGYVTVGTLREYLTDKLNLLDYSGGDEDTDATTSFFYENSDTSIIKSGKASITKMRALLFSENSAIPLEEDTMIRAVGGIISYQAIEDKIYNKLENVFSIGLDDLESDINDGDNFVFIRNGDIDSSYKGISYLTIKEKILDYDTQIDSATLIDTDKIFIIRDDGTHGSITFGELRTKLSTDLFT